MSFLRSLPLALSLLFAPLIAAALPAHAQTPLRALVPAYANPCCAGVLSNGIFLDETTNDIASTGYYQTLTAYVKSKDAGARVFGNPGTTFTQDTIGGTSAFGEDDYATSVDTIVTFENTGVAYRTSYTPPSWLASLAADHFAHIVHSEALTSDMLGDVQLARTRKAGFVYAFYVSFVISLGISNESAGERSYEASLDGGPTRRHHVISLEEDLSNLESDPDRGRRHDRNGLQRPEPDRRGMHQGTHFHETGERDQQGALGTSAQLQSQCRRNLQGLSREGRSHSRRQVLRIHQRGHPPGSLETTPRP